MTVLRILRCLCFCIAIERGNWTPHSPRTLSSRRHLRRKILHKKTKSKSATFVKPDWLKQWTISKGWKHNGAHVLKLNMPRGNMTSEQEDDNQDNSSMSIENIDELISFNSNVEIREKEDDPNDLDRIETISSSSSEIETGKIGTDKASKIKEQRVSEMFLQSSKNYRISFPAIQNHQLPLSSSCQEVENPYDGMIKKMHQSYFEDNNQKIFTFSRNLREEVIYECSEESNSLTIFHNPIYSTDKVKYYDFRTNHLKKPGNFLEKISEVNISKRNTIKFTQKSSRRYLVKTEKYIIQHIRVRFMLALGKKNLGLKMGYRRLKPDSSKVRDERGKENLYESIARVHYEQRKIGSGRVSLKIQNLR